jgi:hypothetical protein
MSRSGLVIVSLALTVGAASCGDPRDGTPSSDVETAAQALLGTNISNALVPNSTFQSETSSVASLGGMAAVAFNTDDSAHGIPNVSKCRLHSQSALSYRSTAGGAWRVIHIPVPTSQGVSILRGDPSTAFFDLGTSYRVFVSSIAISDATWNGLTKRTDGCADNAVVVPAANIDRGCVSAVEIPKSGAAASMGLAFCVAPQVSGQFDGGSVWTGSNGYLYAAYWNAKTTVRRVEVFRTNAQAFTALAVPFPGMSILGHPKFVQGSNGGPALIAPDSGGTFWFTAFNETTLTWSTPAFVASGFSWQRPITLKDGKTLREVGYWATWFSSGPSPSSLLFFFEKPGTGTFTRLQGVACGTIPSLGCSEMPGWTTSTTANAFMAGIAVAHIPQPPSPYPRVAPWLSYWNDSARSDGQVTMRWAALNFAGSGSLTLIDLGTTERPCGAGLYWGDYDQMAVDNDFSASATVLRPFTDSTAATCNTSTGDPQHVSLLSISP